MNTVTTDGQTDSYSYVFRLLLTETFCNTDILLLPDCCWLPVRMHPEGSATGRPSSHRFSWFSCFLASAQAFPKVQAATASFSCSPSDLSSSKLTRVSIKTQPNHFSKIPRAFFQTTDFNIPVSSFSHRSHDKGERAKSRKQRVRPFSPNPPSQVKCLSHSLSFSRFSLAFSLSSPTLPLHLTSLPLSLSLSLQSSTGTGFSSSTSLLPSMSFCQIFQTRLHLHVALNRRMNGWSLGTFQKSLLFWEFGNIGQESTDTVCDSFNAPTEDFLQPDACHLLVTQSVFYLLPKARETI